MMRLKENNFFCLDRFKFEERSEFKFDGYWIDCFKSDWMLYNGFTRFNDGDFLAYVSPELHNRPHKKSGSGLKKLQILLTVNLLYALIYPKRQGIF